MQVECPHCQTVFKLTEEQLQLADGMVRCGLCHEVFNALQADTEADDEHNTADTAAAGDDQPVSSEPEENNRESAPADDLFDGGHSTLIPDEYRSHQARGPASPWRDLAWSIAIITLSLSLFVEYAWFNRNQLITRAELKPWVRQLCAAIDCNPLGLRDPSEIEMIARNIYSHPNIDKALMVSVTIINHATFAQPYPDINIDFSDVRGDVIASRIFRPDEYLLLNSSNIKHLRSGVATDFHLEIQDPGPEAMTYEFSFI